MSDDNKKDDVACEVTVVKHGPNCPVTKEFKRLAQEMIDKAGEEADGENAGPAKYTSRAYRANYDSIFGKKTEIGQA